MNAHGTPNQSGDGKTGPGQEPAPSSDEQTIPPASQESSSLRSQGTDAGNSPWGAPKGYDQVQSPNGGMDLKNQLDAIPTPGLSQPQAAQPRPQAPPPQPQMAAQANGAEEDWKSQLDAIPTPGGSQAPAAPAASLRPAAPPPPPQPQAQPTPAMGDLKSQLDAIPTPGGQQAAPPPQPQAVPPPQPQAAPPPQPQAAPPPQPQTAGEEDWKSQLDSIPTPKILDGGGGSPVTGTGSGLGAGVGAGPGAVRPTPLSTPQPGAMASDMFAGGQGASNQSGIDYARSKEFSSVDTSSGYTMIAVVLVLVVLCVFGFMMMNPGKQPDFSSVPTSAPTTTTTPAPAPAPTTNAP